MFRRVRTPGICVLALLAAGCSSGSEPAEGADPGDAGAADGEQTGPANPRGLPQGPPPNAVGGQLVQLPSFTLEPGQEAEPCWITPLALEGPSIFVNAAVLRTGPGMHHGNVTTRPSTGDGVLRECPDEAGLGEAGDILAGGSVMFASSTQITGEEWRRFPEGMAFRIKEEFEIVFRMHYLNTTAEPLTVTPEYEWYTIPEADMTEELAPFAWDFASFQIPARSVYSVETECTFAEPMKIVNALPHMHGLGTRFWVGYKGGPRDGELFLDSVGYDPEAGVIFQWDEGIDLSQGDGAFFGCEWNNTFDKTITSGIGDNEMCILFGYSYPADSAYSALILNEQSPCTAIRGPAPDGSRGAGL